jgi:glutathione peroxidase
MRAKLLIAPVLVAITLATGFAASGGGLLDHSFRPLARKQPVNLGKTYAGDVLLVVNTVRKCGFTPQFEALEVLHRKYRGKGFAVLGFPSGDFKAQEFDDEGEIAKFCTLTYGVKFPMFEKVHVWAMPPRRCTSSWRPPRAKHRSGISTST